MLQGTRRFLAAFFLNIPIRVSVLQNEFHSLIIYEKFMDGKWVACPPAFCAVNTLHGGETGAMPVLSRSCKGSATWKGATGRHREGTRIARRTEPENLP